MNFPKVHKLVVHKLVNFWLYRLFSKRFKDYLFAKKRE